MTNTYKISQVKFEVVQSIQNLENKIELFKNKKTLVRVYMQTENIDQTFNIKGKLRVNINDKQAIILPSENIILLYKDGQPEWEIQRGSLKESLNFILPDECLNSDEIQISLDSITPVNPDITPLKISTCSEEFCFSDEIPFKLRIIGFKVPKKHRSDHEEPTDYQLYEIGDWIKRAFPCSNPEVSYCFLEATEDLRPPYTDGSGEEPDFIWQQKHNLACSQIMAHRAMEIEHGRDPRTLYYGVIKHSEPITGAVSNVAVSDVRPDIVGVGPALDDGGRLGAHEIGHGLGLLHPGFGSHQSREDENFPKENIGRISNSAERYIGWDNKLERIMHYDYTYDFMTGLSNRWVSDYHYLKLIETLRGIYAMGNLDAKIKQLHVSGVYWNIENEENGKILFVDSVTKKLPSINLEGTQICLVTKRTDGCPLETIPIEKKNPKAKDLHQCTGAFQVTINHSEELDRIELHIKGRCVHSWPYENLPTN